MEYHPLIEDKSQYPYNKERTKFFFKFLLQIHTHENVLT